MFVPCWPGSGWLPIGQATLCSPLLLGVGGWSEKAKMLSDHGRCREFSSGCHTLLFDRFVFSYVVASRNSASAGPLFTSYAAYYECLSLFDQLRTHRKANDIAIPTLSFAATDYRHSLLQFSREAR